MGISDGKKKKKSRQIGIKKYCITDTKTKTILYSSLKQGNVQSPLFNSFLLKKKFAFDFKIYSQLKIR